MAFCQKRASQNTSIAVTMRATPKWHLVAISEISIESSTGQVTDRFYYSYIKYCMAEVQCKASVNYELQAGRRGGNCSLYCG